MVQRSRREEEFTQAPAPPLDALAAVNPKSYIKWTYSQSVKCAISSYALMQDIGGGGDGVQSRAIHMIGTKTSSAFNQEVCVCETMLASYT